MNSLDDDPGPPGWAEFIVRLLLRPRDREAVTGDLLEEYRETILPAQGRVRAGVWYLRQAMGLMTHWSVSLLRAIGVAAAVVITALIGGGFLFVATHRSSSAESVETANMEFQQLRARFINQRALLDMNQRQARIDAGAAKNPAPLHTFHTVIFDTRGGQRLVHMTVPYWWARRYGQHGEIKHTSGSALDAVQAARVERIGVSVSQCLRGLSEFNRRRNYEILY